MEFFKIIKHEALSQRLEMLVIGGLAVNFYGYSRETGDVDLLICRDARSAWEDLISKMGYVLDRDAGTFLQFSPPRSGEWPLDVMLVQAATFAPMMAASNEVDLYGARMRIPSLDHLIALKLHALKHTRLHRFLKDFQDLEGLVLINKLDLKSEKIRQMFLKYGSLDLYEKIVRACSSD